MTYDETFNRIRTFSSLDLIQRFSAQAQGEVLGIGGSVSSSTEAHAHTELETEQFNKTRKERVIETSSHLCYPGPLYRIDTNEQGIIIGRTLVEEGPIWIIQCPMEIVETVTPITENGEWEAALEINIENWAGNYSVMPDGEHDNVLKFSGTSELIAFMEGDLVLEYKWLPKLKLSRQSLKGLAWLKDPKNRRVGPVYWDRVERNSNVAALEPTIVEPN